MPPPLMPVYHWDLLQGTDEWLALRVGRLTSSNAHAVIGLAELTGEGSKRDALKGREDLIWRLALERVTGVPVTGGVSTDAMDWGTKTEPLARDAYADAQGVEVRECGFVSLGDTLGESPDGLVSGADGAVTTGVEIKCPYLHTHAEYSMLGGVEAGVAGIPRTYLRQMLHHLLVVPVRGWDFWSWSPAFPPGMRAYRARLERDAVEANGWLPRYRDAAASLEAEVAETMAVVRERMSR